jgi:hypothetical protein
MCPTAGAKSPATSLPQSVTCSEDSNCLMFLTMLHSTAKCIRNRIWVEHATTCRARRTAHTSSLGGGAHRGRGVSHQAQSLQSLRGHPRDTEAQPRRVRAEGHRTSCRKAGRGLAPDEAYDKALASGKEAVVERAVALLVYSAEPSNVRPSMGRRGRHEAGWVFASR